MRKDRIEFICGYNKKTSRPEYNIKEIYPEEVKRECNHALQKYKYYPLDGSTKFRVMVVDPHLEVVKVASHLCICDNCTENYGSCPLFQSLDLRSMMKLQNKQCLRKDLDGSDNEK